MTAAFPIATRVLREQTNPADSVASTARTVAWMGQLSRDAARDPMIQGVAAEIRRRAPGGSVRDLCAGVWEFVKRRVRFVQDDAAIRRLFNESGQLELLIHPVVLLSMAVPAGDCDDFTMLGCALLLALGLDPTIVCLCCDSAAPGRFSHVFLEVSDGGRRWPVDASHGRYFGWEVPEVDVYRRQGWNCNGRKLYDVSNMRGLGGVGASHGSKGVPMIIRAPRAGVVVRRRPVGRLGMGADGDTWDMWGDGGVTVPTGGGASTVTLDFPWLNGGPTAAGAAAGSTASGGDHAIRDTLLGLLRQTGNIFQQRYAPLNAGEYIQNADGTVRARNVPGAVPTPNTGLNVTAGGMSGGTLLLLVGVVGVAAFAMSRSRG